MTKIWAAIAVLVLVIAAAVWLILAPAPERSGATAEKRSFTWNITELGEHASAPGVPRTGVTLTSSGTTYPVGEFDGSCAEIDGMSWPLAEGEKTGVICWWAGGGSEVGVFEEGGKFVLKVGILEEGSAETPGFRGNYETIATIE
jgi:hypothetical protein